MNHKLFLFAAAVFICTNFAFGTNFPFSANPPGGLTKTNVPQFVVLGSDDNTIDSGVTWITDYLTGKTNPTGINQTATLDGAPVHMNFYLVGYAADSLTSPDIVAAWKAAYDAGHEIGNHSYDHVLDLSTPDQDERNGYAFNIDAWMTEILQGDTAIAKALGISYDSIPYVIKGFRTPRLQYNDSTFLAIQQRGFLYDCSIEEGYEDGELSTPNQTSCGAFYWPFTLDNGSQSDMLNALWWADDPVGWTFISCGKIPGLWEVPVYCLILPDSAYAASNGADPYIRDSAAAHCEWLAEGGYKVTGFDYNLLATYENGSYALDSAGYYVTMKYNFDQCLAGNRRPFTLNIHTDECFPEPGNTEDNPNITPLQRRQCIENMIDYMLTIPDVRFITASELVEWMEAPVGLDGTIGSPIKFNANISKTAPIAVHGISKGNIVFTAPTAGTYTIGLYNV
ncbi:MAG: polysaccharide deacetylase family protein, partial [Bacteroidota bacterium]